MTILILGSGSFALSLAAKDPNGTSGSRNCERPHHAGTAANFSVGSTSYEVITSICGEQRPRHIPIVGDEITPAGRQRGVA